MHHNDLPDTTYTTTWSIGRGEVRFFTRPDGSRLRYYTAGTGPPLVLMHTVRTQLDYFQRVIPLLWDHYTVHALDLPGMDGPTSSAACGTRSRSCGKRSVKEFPGIRSIEAPDDYRLQERWFEIA
jgi:pimeloyl-ACP methyl ester carboxylesterase